MNPGMLGGLTPIQFSFMTELREKFATDNIYLNVIIQTTLMTFVGYLMTQFPYFLEQFRKYIIDPIITYFYFISYKIGKIFRNEIVMIPKTITIPLISEQKKINELYDVVYWYLTHNHEIDYMKEDNLEYFYETRITSENESIIKNSFVVNKTLKNNATKKIKYKKHDITYSFSKEMLTLYTGEKEKKRENHIITLFTEVSETNSIDILEDFCKHCSLKFIESKRITCWVQHIYVNTTNGWDTKKSNNTRKMDTIILREGLKDEIKQDLELFLNSEEWYSDRDIPYTRGYLFYGYPGTGKTSMIKAMSLFSKRHIHYLMLQNIKTDLALIELMKGIDYTKTILVIEDIDATVQAVISREKKMHSEESSKNNKKNAATESMIDAMNEQLNSMKPSEPGITLSGLLNALDGIFDNHGRILIMTTNHPDILDEALIRPGRIDCKYRFDKCDKIQIKNLYEMFFNKSLHEKNLDIVKNNKYSPAEVTSIFLRYRNNPDEALLHLDDIENKPTSLKESK